MEMDVVRQADGRRCPEDISIYNLRSTWEIGLGSIADITRLDARIAAEEARRDLRESHDPRKLRRIALGQTRGASETLEAVGGNACQSHKKTLKHGRGDPRTISDRFCRDLGAVCLKRCLCFGDELLRQFVFGHAFPPVSVLRPQIRGRDLARV